MRGDHSRRGRLSAVVRPYWYPHWYPLRLPYPSLMARRSNPQNIYAARRAAVLSRLTQEHRLSEERAEALVAAWEAEGDARGLDRITAAFWEAGTAWIEEQLGD